LAPAVDYLIQALSGSGGEGGGGPCFIATAAYGTPLAVDIDVLRALRDTWLLDNALGVAFVDAYYSISPFLADWVARSAVLAAMVRALLVPVILVGRVALAVRFMPLMLMTGIGITLAGLRTRFHQKDRD